MTKSTRPIPVVLAILDGWGCGDVAAKDNAIAKAYTPFWDKMSKTCPHSELETSGLDVGLPKGQMGNSEVGHMNIGSGRVVMQELPRIDQAIADGSLQKNPALIRFINALKKGGGTCHLMGLISPGGVHAHQVHIAALANYVSEAGVPVMVHAFLDGRDTPPCSAKEYITQFEKAISGCKNARITTVSGRYYAMDRDNRWERVQLAYDAMVLGKGEKRASVQEAIAASYKAEITDEFMKPCIIGKYVGMLPGDGLLMGNYRSDRARQILSALLDPAFKGFARKPVEFAAALGMVEYSSAHTAWMKTLFPAHALTQLLSEVISNAGLTQLHIAETEKYAHVTFFFNGGREEPFPGEERILIPSPKVATYDLKPEMSAPEVADAVVHSITEHKHDFIVVNFANTDMVGHTGIMEAAIKAVEAVDKALSRIAKALEEKGGAMFITADHGNAEHMHDDETGQAHTAHTTNPVPFILVGKCASHYTLSSGRLADIAPTILTLMGLPIPKEMTGTLLLHPKA